LVTFLNPKEDNRFLKHMKLIENTFDRVKKLNPVRPPSKEELPLHLPNVVWQHFLYPRLMNNFFFYSSKENIAYTRNFYGLRKRMSSPFRLFFDFLSPHLFDFFFLSDEHYSIYFREVLNRKISVCAASENNVVWSAYDRWGFLNQRYCLLEKDNWFYLLREYCNYDDDKLYIKRNLLISDRLKYNKAIKRFYHDVYFVYGLSLDKDNNLRSKFEIVNYYEKLRLQIKNNDFS
jgi:hypothetical protein